MVLIKLGVNTPGLASGEFDNWGVIELPALPRVGQIIKAQRLEESGTFVTKELVDEQSDSIGNTYEMLVLADRFPTRIQSSG